MFPALSFKGPVACSVPAIVICDPPGKASCEMIESFNSLYVIPVIGSVVSKNNGIFRVVPLNVLIMYLARSLTKKFFVGFLNVAFFSVPNNISLASGNTVG